MPVLILSPFIIAPLGAWLAARWSSSARVLAVWPAILTAIFASELAAGQPRTVEWPWAPSLGLSLSFRLDALGLLFALLITGVGTLIVVYASSYLRGHRHAARFYAALFAFMGAMLGVVLSDNLLSLFVFWELTGFTSFVLIGFETERAEARAAAVQALIVTGGGGLALLAASVLLQQATGTWSLAVLATGPPGSTLPVYPAVAGLVLLAAFTKSAQVPFHFWLPDAMAAPTPVSAYLHSATMVKAGVYLLARMTPLLGGTPLWTTTVTVVGALTMVGGAWRSVQETDLKRILAYSTVSALGVLVMLLGVGTRDAVIAALAYLLAHAMYKGALFLVAGAVDHETGTRDVTALGGLRHVMPRTAAAAALAAVSMAGVPLTLGFVAKEAAYASLQHAPALAAALVAATVVASILMGLAGFTAGVAPFAGRPGRATTPHDAPWPLWAPPMLLGVLALACGVLPGMLDATIGAAAEGVLGTTTAPHFAIWHGLTPALALGALTLASIAGLYVVRDGVRQHAWPRSLSIGRWYTGGIGILDAISRTIGPPLQSASLRSYVLTIVATASLLVGWALATGGAVHEVKLATPVRLHEILIVGLVIAGAVSAARATSSMAAVVSLGTVGYGMAFLFQSFGAPDLAMTQFSVETLTVVIFVLVFRHFPRFGSLSRGLVRTRDAAIATAFGALIAALVLFVGTSGVPSRLAGFFADNALPLAHGRNIVNVILVDFRALDTLGEITVLTTAAIGVHALLRIGAGRPPAWMRSGKEPRP